MSKNRSHTPQMILCQTSDLSAAVDALRAEIGDAAPSKSQMLNILAATLCGPRRNWGFVKTAPRPVVSQRLEPELNAYIIALMEERPDLGRDDDEEESFEDIVYAEAYDAFMVAFENDSDVRQLKESGKTSHQMIADFCHDSAERFYRERSENPMFENKVLNHGPAYVQEVAMEEADRHIEKFLGNHPAN